MSRVVPPVEVGDPTRHGALCVFPLFTEMEGKAEYRLAEDAIADGSLTVEEVGESGTVPLLTARNTGDSMALFLEGQQLLGAKQNRVLNASVLVAAGKATTIPVSCVERGRWSQRSKSTSSHPSHVPHSIRHLVHRDVHRSTRRSRTHSTDQSAVWGKIDELHRRTSTTSHRAALSDAHLNYAAKGKDLLDAFPYPDGAQGLAVTWQGAVLSIDLFDRPGTCRRVWPRLLSAHVFTMGRALPGKPKAGAKHVRETLVAASSATWEQVPAAGAGVEYRARMPSFWASSLGVEESPVHTALLVEDLDDDAIE